MTRDYIVSNECDNLAPNQVSITEIVRKTGKVKSRDVVNLTDFPNYINSRKTVIFPEEFTNK